MKNNYSDAKLLETVCYISRTPSIANDILGNEITVLETFPYNPESKTAPETAKNWATRYDRNAVVTPTPVTLENVPFKVTITDLHHRGEGGRAYKVVDEQMRQFDLREDQVMEVMKRVGIAPGGAIPGTFVWGILGSQVRLVLVGGELHTKMSVTLQTRQAAKEARKAGLAPTPSKLQKGHVYLKRDGSACRWC